MQDTVNEIANLAHQTSSHNSSWATVSVLGGGGVVTAGATAPATTDFWIHLGHLSILFGLALCVTGLVRFYWDAKARWIAQQQLDQGE